MDLKHILEQVSQLLFYPVLVLLVVLIVWMLIAFGMFVRSALGRWRGSRPAVTRYTGQINAAAAHASNHLDIRIEQVLAQAEHASLRSLNAVRFAVRAGPSLGLMGTLIPLGPALVGLAAGDISLLARKMEVAFATTVVGLVIGAIGFLLHQAAQRWAMDDLSSLDFLSAKLREPS